jgi:hypothetical protein
VTVPSVLDGQWTMWTEVALGTAIGLLKGDFDKSRSIGVGL